MNRREITETGKKLYTSGLVCGRSGNLSCRIDKNHILITSTGSFLGNLTSKDILKVSLDRPEKRVSSEFPLHCTIYKNFPVSCIIHCHPHLTNAYFATRFSLKPLTLETDFYLPKIPVIKQTSPTVKNIKQVIKALKEAHLVVLKNHGVVCMGHNFKDLLYLIETLENAIKVVAVARLFKKSSFNKLEN
ncbi:MAG: class II aldolase/adducin family protein [Candidatus Omnitrophica bacterium]|nr:class II aldolase/adducin family protein [Candidatus Omnitrophota bacterium]